MSKENQEKPILLQDLGCLYPTETSKQRYRYGLYKCFCGKEFKAQQRTVVNCKATRSCGCHNSKLTIDRCTTHGLTNHRLYKTWNNMIHRCTNTKNKYYKDYGGRGVSICDRWLSIENFIADMESTYQDGLTIDRIDVNGNYEPSNCRWTTQSIQSRNTRLLYKHNTSGYRGVSFIKRSNKFASKITVNNKSVFLGYFENATDGAKAYNNYIVENNLEHHINII